MRALGLAAAAVVCAVPAPAAAQTTFYVNSFAPYPGYTGGLTVTGSATVVNSNCGSDFCQAMGWSLSGVDRAGGGIHIHDGTDCESCAASTCGHFYVGSQDQDPWSASVYANSNGFTTQSPPTDVSQMISSGEPADQVLGKVVVVHDSAGARIACGMITDTSATGGGGSSTTPPGPGPGPEPEPEPEPGPGPISPASSNGTSLGPQPTPKWMCADDVLCPHNGNNPKASCVAALRDSTILGMTVRNIAQCIAEAKQQRNQCSDPCMPGAIGQGMGPQSCAELFKDMGKCFGIGDGGAAYNPLTGQKPTLEDVKPKTLRCTGKVMWGDSPEQTLLLRPSAEAKKMCFPTDCSSKDIEAFFSDDLVRQLNKQNPELAVTTAHASCDVLMNFINEHTPLYFLAGAVAMVVLSVILIRVIYIAPLVKLLMYIYVAISGIVGFIFVIYGAYLALQEGMPKSIFGGCMAVGLVLLLFVWITFKGLRTTPCLLNIAFLLAVLISVVFLVLGIILATSVGTEIQNSAMELLRKNKKVSDETVEKLYDVLESAHLALNCVLFLMSGTLGSIFVFSIKVKHTLQEGRKKEAKEQILQEIKSDEKKEAEREKWREQMAKKVAKEDKKKGRS